MSDIQFFLSNLWRWKCGMKEKAKPEKAPELLTIFKVNWSPAFEQFMRNRLAMGYFRYGPLNKQPKGLYDNVGSIRKRLALFEKTGNDEILVDIANLCMCEFVNGTHPTKHFKSVDDGIHVEQKG